MATNVFFCYHHESDSWRVNQVIQHWLMNPAHKAHGYIDIDEYEEIKSQGEEAIKKWVDEQLKDTTVTVVLIGSNTSESSFAKYAIKKSMEKPGGVERGFMGIHINRIKNEEMERDDKGVDPLENFYWKDKDNKITFISDKYLTYDWFDDKGQINIQTWVNYAEAIAQGRMEKAIE